MKMAKFSDPFPRLIHECARDIGLSILVGLGLIMASVASAASINPTLKFQQDPQHVEYNDLAHVILKEAYRRIGHPIAKDRLDTKRGLTNTALDDGILISPVRSALQDDYIRIPIAIVKLKVFAYVHKSHEHTRYEFGLLGNRVSIVKGMPMIQNNMMGMVATQMNSVNNSLKSILRNQADLVLLPEFCALSRSKKHLREQVIALQPAVFEVPMYHYISKKNEHLVESLKRSLNGMKKKQLITQVTQSFKHVIEADAEA